MKNPKRKKILAIKLIAVTLALVTAICISIFSNTQDVNQRSIVTMIGIDASSCGGVVVSTHMLVATPGIMENEFREDMSIVTGRNIFDALGRFNVAKGRKVEFSQTGLVVFGKDIQERGILEICKALLSSNIVSGGVLVLATDGDACDFLRDAAALGEVTSENIARFLTRFQNTLEMPMAVLLSYLDAELSESGASFIPIVTFKSADENCHTTSEKYELRDVDEDSQDENYPDVRDDNDENVENDNHSADDSNENDESADDDDSPIDINSVNTAIVLKQGKHVGYLNAQETLGLNLLSKDSRRGRLSIDGFNVADKEFGAVFAHVRSKNVRARTSFVDDKPHITYTLNIRLDIASVHEFNILLDSNECAGATVYQALEAAFSQKIKNDITATLNACTRLNADFINLKSLLYRTSNADMHRYMADCNNNFWNDLVAVIDVNVKAR